MMSSNISMNLFMTSSLDRVFCIHLAITKP
jgi:hypothetical protein